MPYDLSNLLVIGVSSRALFDLEEEERVYNRLGLEKYREYQLEKEDDPLTPGTAFPLIRRLLALNDLSDERLVEVVVVSQNNPETGLRIFRSIEHHGLDISRAAFVGGEPLPPYLQTFSVDLFLSRSPEDVQQAIDAGVAAAVLYNPVESTDDGDQLRIAFDADAVLFSEESEAIYRNEGLEAFLEHERNHADKPLLEGPLAKLLVRLSKLQAGRSQSEAPVRLAIVTARNSPAHERVIRTLRTWDVRVDAAFFLGGVSKDGVLRAFGAHIFFDDQETHLAPASRHVPCALVPYSSTSVLRVERSDGDAEKAAGPEGADENGEPDVTDGDADAA